MKIRVALVARACFLASGVLALSASARAEEWPQFRGPHATGAASSDRLPTEWAPDKNVVWKTRVPGIGWSQPVVWDSKVFLTTAESDDQARPDPGYGGPGPGRPGLLSLFSGGGSGLEPPDAVFRWKVLCLDAATGEVLWERTAREGRPAIPVHPNNTYASETPVTDGERLVAYFGMTGIWCYDLNGNVLWSRDFEAYPTQFDWGTGSSPVLWGDHVFIQCDNDKASFLVALDKRTGKEVWRVEREERSNWSTPYVWQNALRTELVTAGGHRMRSYDPNSGELLWEMQGSGRTSSTPTGSNDVLYVDSYDRLTGRTGIFAAIRPGAAGDISLSPRDSTNSHVMWSTRLAGYRIASPLLYENRLYVLEQNGIARCLDARTGQEHYRKRVPGAKGFTSSPVAAGGKVYCVDQHGRTIVLDAGSELRVIATNDLNEMTWASPAVAGDRLLIRTVDHLFCLGHSVPAGDVEE